MSYVPEYRFDLFLSYASADDVVGPQCENGWVTEFSRDLETALRQRLGGSDQLSFYFDKRELGANHDIDSLLSAVKESACFLSVCSRSYVQREWTTREIEQFCIGGGQQNRLFVVDILPLGEDEPYPGLLADRHRMPFFRMSPVTKVAVPFTRIEREYGLLIHDLAEQIRIQLMAMRTVSGFKDAAEVVQDDIVGRRQVLLAQVTEDLDERREELRRYLEQFGHRVLPSRPYRQDGLGFCEDVSTDLERADTFIQLLSALPGRSPPDLPDGYVKAQIALAIKAGLPMVQWRAPDLDIEAIQDAAHRRLIDGETVIASGFESFKAIVRDQLEEDKDQDEPGQRDATLQTVFINADEADLDYARHVRDEFVRSGFMAATPTADLRPDMIKEHLLDCDALVLLYGNASHVWADRSLRLFNKLRAKRERPPKIVAVLLGPPPEKLDDLGINMPGLKFYGDPTEWTRSSVEEVIEALKT